jgi:GNAT superfamily N-acetyltransferase
MVAVRPDLQGRGLGRKLLSDLLRRWDAEDGRALLMMTQDHRALRMYARCGFEPLEGGPSEEKHPQGGFSNWVRLRPGRQQSGDE